MQFAQCPQRRKDWEEYEGQTDVEARTFPLASNVSSAGCYVQMMHLRKICPQQIRKGNIPYGIVCFCKPQMS